MYSVSRKAVLALIGATFVLHAIEEYLTFPAFLSSPSSLPPWLPPARFLQDSHDFRAALVMLTVVVVAVISWAVRRPSGVPLILSLLIEAILLVNAAWHIFASFARSGYAPGVITAVVVNLPFGIYVLRRAVKEQWIWRRVAWQLICIALALHLVLLGTMLAG
jgi:hypothetical protein